MIPLTIFFALSISTIHDICSSHYLRIWTSLVVRILFLDVGLLNRALACVQIDKIFLKSLKQLENKENNMTKCVNLPVFMFGINCFRDVDSMQL